MTVSFAGRTAVLATRHGKEAVIVPALRDELGLHIELSSVDTDRFGTFTREVPRLASARETVRAKALAALAEHDRASFAIASEGSFGPHPTIPVLAAGAEMVFLLERGSAFELLGVDVTTDTNFDSKEVRTLEESVLFASQVRFPSHGVIVMASESGRPDPTHAIEKGIVDPEHFAGAVERLLRARGSACVESDMRAHVNPTRMRSIERATRDLARAAKSLCPRCGRPGYGVTSRIVGLPCADCGAETRCARAEVLSCAGCPAREERRVVGTDEAPPGLCDVCNP